MRTDKGFKKEVMLIEKKNGKITFRKSQSSSIFFNVL